jgi:UDP-glucose 4-epimerase
VKLLVTGGAGYIGSVVAHQLLEAGHETVVVLQTATGMRDWEPEKPELEAMISDAWDWMQAHPNGYE